MHENDLIAKMEKWVLANHTFKNFPVVNEVKVTFSVLPRFSQARSLNPEKDT